MCGKWLHRLVRELIGDDHGADCASAGYIEHGGSSYTKMLCNLPRVIVVSPRDRLKGAKSAHATRITRLGFRDGTFDASINTWIPG